MDTNLFKAILSLDSYNRGYGQGIKLSDVVFGTTKLGEATLSQQSYTADGKEGVVAGFYAIAYKYNGYTVISYRGTDQFLDDPKTGIGGDIDNGWGIGTGGPFGPQATLGIDFYKAVVGTGGSVLLNNIIFTGHSLGGGLAGFVGGLYGKTGTVFDSMTYQDATNNAHDLSNGTATVWQIDESGAVSAAQILALKNHIYGTSTPWDVNYAGIKAIHMDGESLVDLRWFGYTGAQTPYFLESDVTLSGANRHKIDTLIIVMFGKDSVVAQDWTKAEKYFIPSLYDNDVALKAGADNVAGTMQSEGDHAGILRTTIAYSAIDNGTNDIKARPFGDTGIRALFNDANEWGKVLKANPAPSLINDLAASVSNIFTQFAGKLAIDKVLQSNSPTAIDGVLKLSGNGLDIDFGNKLWGTTSSIAGRTELFNNIFAGRGSADIKNVDSSMQALWGSSSKGIFEDVILATASRGSTISFTDTPATSKANLFVGSLGADGITGSGGKDLMLGYDGNDGLSAGAGKDILWGGKGNDSLLGGTDNDKFIINNGDGWDTIYDRQHGDRIVFNGTELTGTATYQGNGVYSLLGFKLWQSGYTLEITSPDGVTTMAVKEFFTTSNGVYFDTTNNGITVPGNYKTTGTPKTYTGTEQNDVFNLVGGPNIVNALGGNDTIGGASTVDGGAGNDYIRGTSSTDVLNGGGDNDIIVTNGGLDIVNGGTGNDRIISGVGAQKIFGDGGIDTVEYSSSMGGVEVNLALTTLQEGGTYSSAYGDILSGIENITGSSYADTLTGNTANNVLTGRSGADRLTGGMGADVFKYNAPTSAGTDSGTTVASRDVITDFANGIDKIDLAAFAGTFTFMGKSAFTGTPNQLNYAQVAGNTIINLDTDGNKIVDGQIQLLGLHNMTATDFML